MSRRFCSLLFAALALAACQSPPPSSSSAATAPADSRPAQLAYTHELALRLYRDAHYQAAETLCLHALAEVEKSQGPKSPDLASPLDDLATIYLRQARFAEAKPVIERAQSVLDKSVPAQAFLLGRLAINKGWRLYSLGDNAAAEKVFAEGRDLVEKNHPGDSLELAELINNLGLMYDESDDPDQEPDEKRVEQARRLLLKGWQMRRRLTGEESAETGESLNNLGMHLLYHADDPEEFETALNTLQKSLKISEKVYGADHPETAVSLVNLAIALSKSEEPADLAAAEEDIRKALPMTEKAFGRNHPDRAYELQVLGHLQMDHEKYADAEASFLESVRISEAVYGKNHPNVANALEDLSDLYETTGDEAKQKAILDRIDQLRGKEI